MSKLLRDPAKHASAGERIDLRIQMKTDKEDEIRVSSGGFVDRS